MKQPGNKRLIWIMIGLAMVVTLILIGILAFTPQRQTIAGTPPPVPGDDWPTYLHDIQRTASSRESVLSPATAPELSRAWAFKTGGGIAASPVVVNGTVYIGSWDGYEYALDAATGFLKWKTFLGKTSGNCVPPLIGITSSATVENNVVYVGGGDSYWYALDAYTGSVLWRIFTGDNSATSGFYNWSSPLIYKGNAYIGIASNCDNPLVQGRLLKVDLQKHQIVASANLVADKEVGGGIWTSPSIDTETNTIFVTTGTQNQVWQNLTQAIVSLDAGSLKLKGSWQIPPSQSGGDYDWGNSPVLMSDAAGRKLVAGTNKNGFTYAFLRDNISAGPIWEQQTGLGGECPPCGEGSVSSGAFANGTLFMAGGNTTINGTGYPGAVRAIDPSNGKNRWEHGTPFPIIPAIAYTNGLIINGEGQTIEVLDARNGKRLYSYETGNTLYGPPAVAHGQIFMGSLDGNVYAFGVRTVSDHRDSLSQCPQSWSCIDVGNPKLTGSVKDTHGTWSIAGSGSGLADVFDQFQFVHQSEDGDTEISTKLTGFKNGTASSRAGVMFRQRLERGAPFYAAVFAPDGKISVRYRTAFNGGITATMPFTLPGHPNFVGIQRIKDRYQTAISTDGKTYTLVPGSLVTLVMPDQLLGGLLVSSGTNTSVSTASFNDVHLGLITFQAEAPESPSACPENWSCADVGSPSVIGNQLFDSGLWTIQGEGKDIWSTHDEFHFVWQKFPENATITAHITNQQATDKLAKAGLMIRSSTDMGAPYYAAFFMPQGGLTVQARSIRGLNAQVVTTNVGIKAPNYLRIARWQNIFTTYVSADGLKWTALGGSSLTINEPGPMLSGMVVTSHKKDEAGSANFDSVEAEPTAEAAPTACPESWSCADIGYPAPKGVQLFDATNKVWTLQGGGFDIFFKNDQFHYVWRETVGYSAISARVAYVAGGEAQGNDYAKAGVMLRQNTDGASPYYAAFLTPEHGVMVQYRKKQGDGTGEAILPDSYRGALYLKVERSGDLYTAYVSKDGVAWSIVDGSAVNIGMSDTLLMGLAVSSHNPGAAREVTFNDLNIG